MKKLLLILALLLVPMLAFAFSSSIEVREDLFHSDKELAAFQVSPLQEEEEPFYETMEIYLLTGGPGTAIWENFGHAAFVVKHPMGVNISFDYGIFTFDDSFYRNFVLGKLYYQVWETYADYRVDSLQSDDRTVELLKLDLTTQQKKAMWEFLLYNIEDENRTYLYDYFVDNCATRLRDIYSWTTGDDFKAWLKNQDAEETIRETVTRYLFRSTFVPAWVLNYLLGPSVDQKITMWEACFLPDVLEAKLSEYEKVEPDVIYTTEHRRSVPESWSLPLRSLLMGIILGLCVYGTTAKRKWLQKTADCLLGLFYLAMFVISSVLLFMMWFTIHKVTHGNINVLIFSPLSLLMAIAHFSSMGKKRKTRRLERVSLLFFTATILTGLALLLVPALIQDSTSVLLPAVLLYGTEAFFNHRKD